MIDKQKIQNVIKFLLNKEAISPYEQHVSSAQNFETELKKHGFEPPVEICHKYKFPKGYNETSFERYIFQQIYIHLFDSDRIINTEKYIKKFYKGSDVPKQIQKEYLGDLLKVTGQLSIEEKKHVADFFRFEQPKAFPRMSVLLPELKSLNPEIADINPQTPFDFYNLYIGMTSRFHPEDIKYFLSTKDFEEADRNRDKIKEIFGFAPEFRIAPGRVKQLIDSVTFQKQ